MSDVQNHNSSSIAQYLLSSSSHHQGVTMKIRNWKHTFALIWSGQAISILTSSVFGNAIIWYLTYRTGSAAILSAAAFMNFLPRAIFGPFIGPIIDRFDRKRIMIVSDLLVSAVSMVMIIPVVFGDFPVWVVLLALGIRSIATAFHEPSLQAVTPTIVPEEALVKCSGWSSSVQSASLIAGPAIAAFLYPVVGLPVFLVLDVVGAILAALFLLPIYIPGNKQHEETEEPIREHSVKMFVKEIQAGFAILSEHKGIAVLVWIGFVFSLLYVPVSALFPLMTISYMQGNTLHAGSIEVVFSAGMLIGGVVIGIIGIRKRIRAMILALFGISLMLVVTGLLPPAGFPAFIATSFGIGFAAPFYSGSFMTLIQEKIPSKYLGRVLSLSGGLMSFACPLGLILSGLFAEILGVTTWFWLTGLLVLLLLPFFNTKAVQSFKES